MRNSKSRNRSKNNRNRSVGNVINRVFDSSGPEGKVRGTPQQIIDKYNQLARDAQLSGDRVAVENFQQHSEHYLRLLAEATREQEAKREQQERENRERQAQRDQERNERKDDDDAAPAQSQPAHVSDDPSEMPQPDALAVEGDAQSPLVATPEQAEDAPKPRRKRAPKPKPETDAAPEAAAE